MSAAPPPNDPAEREIDAFWPTSFLTRYGADLDAVLATLERNTERFLASLAAIGRDALYVRVDPDRWSPAEVADHVIRAGGLFALALERTAAGRERIEMPRGRVGPEGKPRTPPGGEPRAGRERSALEHELASVHERIAFAARAAAAADALQRPCLRQSFLGPLDALQVAQLAAWHVGHHRRQLEKG